METTSGSDCQCGLWADQTTQIPVCYNYVGIVLFGMQPLSCQKIMIENGQPINMGTIMAIPSLQYSIITILQNDYLEISLTRYSVTLVPMQSLVLRFSVNTKTNFFKEIDFLFLLFFEILFLYLLPCTKCISKNGCIRVCQQPTKTSSFT